MLIAAGFFLAVGGCDSAGSGGGGQDEETVFDPTDFSDAEEVSVEFPAFIPDAGNGAGEEGDLESVTYTWHLRDFETNAPITTGVTIEVDSGPVPVFDTTSGTFVTSAGQRFRPRAEWHTRFLYASDKDGVRPPDQNTIFLQRIPEEVRGEWFLYRADLGLRQDGTPRRSECEIIDNGWDEQITVSSDSVFAVELRGTVPFARALANDEWIFKFQNRADAPSFGLHAYPWQELALIRPNTLSQHLERGYLTARGYNYDPDREEITATGTNTCAADSIRLLTLRYNRTGIDPDAPTFPDQGTYTWNGVTYTGIVQSVLGAWILSTISGSTAGFPVIEVTRIPPDGESYVIVEGSANFGQSTAFFFPDQIDAFSQATSGTVSRSGSTITFLANFPAPVGTVAGNMTLSVE